LAVIEDSWFSLAGYSRCGTGYTQGTSEVAIIPVRIEPGQLAQKVELSFSDVAEIVENATLQSAPNIVAYPRSFLRKQGMEINDATW
jgi:hypothetical protein